MRQSIRLTWIFAALAVALLPATGWAGGKHRHHQPLVSGLLGSIGSTIGPDGDLYVPEGITGEIARINLSNGRKRTFARGLPPALIGIGGAIDVEFLGSTAYVLVALVDQYVGGDQVDGIYRIDGRHRYTIVANLGQWSEENPPDTAFDLPDGLQFAMQPVDDGFLVSDGHHNRVLHVAIDGDSSVITEVKQFENIVPSGLAATADRVYVAETGPVPNLPETGKVVSFDMAAPDATRVVASGVGFVVDVAFGPGGELYALSQGDSDPGQPAGSPAVPDTGRFLRLNDDGSFTVLADHLNLPTSLQFSCGVPIIVTLTGDVWKLGDKHDGCRRQNYPRYWW